MRRSVCYCGTEARAEHIELLQLTESGIHIAEYLTELPPRELLQARLHNAVRLAKSRNLEEKVEVLMGENSSE